MKKMYLAAGVLAAFTAALHTVGGTAEIKAPLLHSALDRGLVLLLYACWHMVSVTLALSAAAYFYAARTKVVTAGAAVATVVSFMWVSFGAVFIVVDLVYGGPRMLLTLPQWSLLLPVGALGLWGRFRRP